MNHENFKIIRNFGLELWHNAKQAKQKLPILCTEEVAKHRYNICETCEFFTSDARCKQCGCFMKVKVNLEVSKCPDNKW